MSSDGFALLGFVPDRQGTLDFCRGLIEIFGCFAAGDAAECLPGDQVYFVGHEVDRPVAVRNLHAARMPAAQRSLIDGPTAGNPRQIQQRQAQAIRLSVIASGIDDVGRVGV